MTFRGRNAKHNSHNQISLPGTLPDAHLLALLPKGKTLPQDVPQHDLLLAVLKRRALKIEEADRSCGGKYGGWQLGRVADAGFQPVNFCHSDTGAQGPAIIAGRASRQHQYCRAGRPDTTAAGCSNSRIRRLGKRCVVAGAQEKRPAQTRCKKIAL